MYKIGDRVVAWGTETGTVTHVASLRNPDDRGETYYDILLDDGCGAGAWESELSKE